MSHLNKSATSFSQQKTVAASLARLLTLLETDRRKLTKTSIKEGTMKNSIMTHRIMELCIKETQHK
jgi:hypothetical protein